MSSRVHKAVKYLYTGRVPDDDDLQSVCQKLAVVFTFLTLSAQAKEPITMMIFEDDAFVAVLESIHVTWTLLVSEKVAAGMKDTKFTKTSIFPIDESIKVYATFTRMLRSECRVCKEQFVSELNRHRCEKSHVDAKPRIGHSELPVDLLEAHWNGLSLDERKALVKDAEFYLRGIPKDSVLSPEGMLMVAVASGEVDVSGHRLMVALDVCSEHTYAYRIKGSLPATALVTKTDFASGMAHVVMKKLAESQARAAESALLAMVSLDENDVKPAAPKKKKRPKAKKPVPRVVQETEPEEIEVVEPVLDDDIDRRIEEQIEMQRRLERAWYLEQLERVMFSTKTRQIEYWADDF